MAPAGGVGRGKGPGDAEWALRVKMAMILEPRRAPTSDRKEMTGHRPFGIPCFNTPARGCWRKPRLPRVPVWGLAGEGAGPWKTSRWTHESPHGRLRERNWNGDALVIARPSRDSENSRRTNFRRRGDVLVDRPGGSPSAGNGRVLFVERPVPVPGPRARDSGSDRSRSLREGKRRAMRALTSHPLPPHSREGHRAALRRRRPR